MIVCGHDLKPTNPDIPPLPSTSTSCPFSIVSHPWHHLVSFLRRLRLGARVDHGATPTGQRSDRRTAGRVSPRATSSSFEPTTRRRSTSDLSEVQRSTRFSHHRDRERFRICGRGSVPEEKGKKSSREEKRHRGRSGRNCRDRSRRSSRQSFRALSGARGRCGRNSARTSRASSGSKRGKVDAPSSLEGSPTL